MKALAALVSLPLVGLIGLSPVVRCQENKAQEPPPKPVELKALETLVGTWKDEMTFKPSVWTAQERRETASYVAKWVLDGRFVWCHGSGDGNSQDLQLMTYDPAKKAYRRWHFASDGYTSESSGQWSENSKTLTWKCDMRDGITAVSNWRFSDKDTIDWSRVAKDKGGKLYLNIEGKATRRKSPPEQPKDERLDQGPPERQALESYLGNWETETVNKTAEWTPKEVRTTGVATNEWVLGGGLMLQRGKESSGVETLQMRTYDPEQKKYRLWNFDSQGRLLEATGQWDQGSKTMTWKADLGNGITGVNIVRFNGDTIAWKLAAKNENGKVFLDIEGKFTRRK